MTMINGLEMVKWFSLEMVKVMVDIGSQTKLLNRPLLLVPLLYVAWERMDHYPVNPGGLVWILVGSLVGLAGVMIKTE